MQTIGIAGTGRVARALGRALRQLGAPVTHIAGRNTANTRAAAEIIGAEPVTIAELPNHVSHIIISVSDSAIADVAQELSTAEKTPEVAVHNCGVHGPDVLDALAARGTSCATMHPVQTMTTTDAVFEGVTWTVTGEGAAASWIEETVRLLGGRTVPIAASHRALLHASVIMAGNYTTGLIYAAEGLLTGCGLTREQARECFRPLLLSSAANAFALGPVAALTGPIARGDVSTIKRHLGSLEGMDPAAVDLYKSGGLVVLQLAREKGLNPAQADAIEALLRRS